MDILLNFCTIKYVSMICLSNFLQDDMIDDVESFVTVAELLRERGAYKIYVMATHGLLSAEAPRLIEDSHIDEVSILIYTFYLHLCVISQVIDNKFIMLNYFFS